MLFIAVRRQVIEYGHKIWYCRVEIDNGLETIP